MIMAARQNIGVSFIAAKLRSQWLGALQEGR